MTATVELSSCGNIDFGQDPDKPLMGCPEAQNIPVSTLEEASNRCRQYIREHDLGCGNWSGGFVKVNDKDVAYISYNGRVWYDLDLDREYTGDALTQQLQPEDADAEKATQS
jgi:hypothetical protein